MIHLIVLQVLPGLTIWTDEHKTYACLKDFDFTHQSTCHKYKIMNCETDVNTQALKSFNNIKWEIKKRRSSLQKKIDIFNKIYFLKIVKSIGSNY